MKLSAHTKVKSRTTSTRISSICRVRHDSHPRFLFYLLLLVCLQSTFYFFFSIIIIIIPFTHYFFFWPAISPRAFETDTPFQLWIWCEIVCLFTALRSGHRNEWVEISTIQAPLNPPPPCFFLWNDDDTKTSHFGCLLVKKESKVETLNLFRLLLFTTHCNVFLLFFNVSFLLCSIWHSWNVTVLLHQCRRL